MRDSFAKITARAKPIHPYEWLWETLLTDPGFSLRSMFGAKAVYLDGKIALCFCANDQEPWSGVLVCTDRERHAALRAEFPLLTPHSILPKWLYLPASNPVFEKVAEKLVQLARHRDPRLGVLPTLRKKRRPRK